MNQRIREVTERIASRSRETRAAYIESMRAQHRGDAPARAGLAASNAAHVFAAAGEDKRVLKLLRAPNIGIVSAYNDMLSAHQPLGAFPEIIRAAAREVGATAQFAGGVPAMCDGVTQGRAGMELSLFSRDVIALATAVALSHEAFDAALMLGVCDKIVPGLFIGAARFGYLPVVFVPGGPMPSGLPNAEKSLIRKRYAAGDATREELLEAEAASYHAPGTCTFYGTANSNQMLMEIMGLHLPGAAFVPPDTPLRTALTAAAARRAAAMSALGPEYVPLHAVIDERAIVNGIVGLMATGGSTNHTLHLVAMARAVGIQVDWTDFADISAVTPLLTRIYPNGQADVNHFHAAGGTAFVIGELIRAGLLHRDVQTVVGPGLDRYVQEPVLEDGVLVWRPGRADSLDRSVLRGVDDPFSAQGGLTTLSGNLGRAVVKTSAVPADRLAITAPAIVFDSQAALESAFRAGELDGRDFVAVVRYQGPRSNGMPELHKLTPPLGVLQDRGQRVAIVTDGRMSGASGQVLAAIHLTPEAAADGPIARIRNGDLIRIDAVNGTLEVEVPEDEFVRRPAAEPPPMSEGTGRELFRLFRQNAISAEQGAGALAWD
ncbi:MAG TPA: phosphogluconate dehydratase [Longimicrobiales bacterium]|nr:phosphogluconate dehydratase [Longimicrobiales bacterium]